MSLIIFIFLDQADVDGNTALHLACEEDRQDEAMLLVKEGANVELPNKQKKTALDFCSTILSRKLKEIIDNSVS